MRDQHVQRPGGAEFQKQDAAGPVDSLMGTVTQRAVPYSKGKKYTVAQRLERRQSWHKAASALPSSSHLSLSGAISTHCKNVATEAQRPAEQPPHSC
jgi:hypothetical protein